MQNTNKYMNLHPPPMNALASPLMCNYLIKIILSFLLGKYERVRTRHLVYFVVVSKVQHGFCILQQRKQGKTPRSADRYSWRHLELIIPYKIGLTGQLIRVIIMKTLYRVDSRWTPLVNPIRSNE